MEILRLRAFTIGDDPASGNPAGVVLDAESLDEAGMLAIAAELGYSETAFLTAITPDAATIRYFSPRAEIGFCGHATIASAVALARRGAAPVVRLATPVGEVPVEATAERATLIAVDERVAALAEPLLDELLAALRLDHADLDPELAPAFVTGANPHPVVFVLPGVLDRLDHDADAVLALQDREGWDGTVPVVHRLAPTAFVSRNPFPRGGIREDPATGSAAAGLGSVLRARSDLAVPATITIDQGAETGHPSRLIVDIPTEGRIRVTGTAG
ncbi:PhzF family phenazine biosynthesis protein [Protaetiibacter intestinalis]|uniref:PhzF family phenazine biosynthesis isomerase n=1 Tax=Protaetiibacter intestinalis TaxID=2419774 RepID=A0A387B5J2_9MICO|nr:PhzF family phenazine biosynthesis isomerase [Protaetiibacter intestinalis]AYF97008.1 PhzF family phenazine biosynthesis isomerase [Protaetiibacter intestinalis]